MHRASLPKTFALALLTAGLGIAGAQQAQPAQDPNAQPAPMPYHHHAPNPQRQAEFLTRKLNLTPDQTSRIEPILANRDQQLATLRQNGQLAPEDRHQQMRSINQQVQQQMATVLTPDQMAQLKTLRREHHEHHQSGEGNPQAPPA